MAVGGGTTTKEDRRRQKELEEARKAGLVEPEVCIYMCVYCFCVCIYEYMKNIGTNYE